MTWSTPAIPHHSGSNGISSGYAPATQGLQPEFSLAGQEGQVEVTGLLKVQRRVEHGRVKNLVTKSSESTHTKDKRLVMRSVAVEAMADTGIVT